MPQRADAAVPAEVENATTGPQSFVRSEPKTESVNHALHTEILTLPSSKHRAPGTQHAAPGTQHSALGTPHSALGTALRTQHSAPGTASALRTPALRTRLHHHRFNFENAAAIAVVGGLEGGGVGRALSRRGALERVRLAG